MNEIYFLRHFKTQSNSSGLLHGRSLQIPIESGQPVHCDQTFDAIYCSTALRCQQTLTYLTTKSQLNPPVTYTSLLLERSLGILENKPRNEMAAQYPELFHGKKLKLSCTPYGGESFKDFKNRALQFSDTFLKNNNNEHILICSHNQFLKMLYFQLKNIEINQENWESLSFPFGEITRIV